MRSVTRNGLFAIASLFALSCGGGQANQAPPETPLQAPAPEPKPATDPVPPAKADTSKDQADDEAEAEAAEPKAAPAPEPEFKPGMSVEEAIRAVPSGVPRLNLDQEVLAGPLQDPELYAPCKPGAGQHFNVKLAVWNGRVVGMDLTVKPKNAAFESCLRERLSGITWKDRVASLNTIEYAF